MIRIGVIGTGYWGKHHLRIFSKLPCDLIGIADIDPAKEILAKEYKVKFYTDYKKLLKKVDAVSIVTPALTHYQIAKKALKMRKHVFIEKPFVFLKKQARDLIKLSKIGERILMIGHIFLYHPAIIELKKLITSGDLGKIYYVLSQRLNLGIVRSDVNSLWNFAPHDLSIILYLLSKLPRSVICTGQSFLQKNIEDITFLTLKYHDDTIVYITLSWLHPAKVRELTIVGSKKMAVFDDVDMNFPIKIFDKGVDIQKIDREWNTFGEFKMKTRFGDVVTPTLEVIEPLEAELNHFLESIRNKSPVRSDGENGLQVLAILEAATKSMKKGGKIVEIKY